MELVVNTNDVNDFNLIIMIHAHTETQRHTETHRDTHTHTYIDTHTHTDSKNLYIDACIYT